jgi:hypothetical protein
MKIKGGAFEFFQTLPDKLLLEIAINDWESLEKLCMALTIDVQLLKESLYETV